MPPTKDSEPGEQLKPLKITLKLSQSELAAFSAWRRALGDVSQAALLRFMVRDFLNHRKIEDAGQLNFPFR